MLASNGEPLNFGSDMHKPQAPTFPPSDEPSPQRLFLPSPLNGNLSLPHNLSNTSLANAISNMSNSITAMGNANSLGNMGNGNGLNIGNGSSNLMGNGSSLNGGMLGLGGRRKCNNELSLYAKLDICDRVHAGAKRSALAQEYDISNATVTNILKREAAIRAMCAESQDSSRRRLQRRPDHAELNQLLFAWHSSQDPKTVSVSELAAKARVFAAELGDWEFVATPGWLDRFRRQFGLPTAPEAGEPAAKRAKEEANGDGESEEGTGAEASPPTSNFGTSAGDWLSSLGLANETAKELQEVQLENARLQNKKLELEVRDLEAKLARNESAASAASRKEALECEALELSATKLRLEIRRLEAEEVTVDEEANEDGEVDEDDEVIAE